MVTVPISGSGYSPSSLTAGSASLPAPDKGKPQELSHLIAIGAIVTGGALMATGRRKAGLAVAVAGTALALLEEQEVVKSWWHNLPEYLTHAQEFLEKVEGYMEDAAVHGQRLQSLLRR